MPIFMHKSAKKAQNYIPSLTFKEIEERVSKVPAVILPIGGMEPVGERCTLGAVQECVMAISACLAERCNILLEPLLPYSNTTSFRAFGGSIGVKKNIYESMMSNLIKDCSAWGVKHLFILDGTYNSYEVLLKIVKRIEKWKKDTIKVYVLNWQHDKIIKKFIESHFDGTELARCEFGIISMAAYINPSLVKSKKIKKKAKSLCTMDVYRRWHKLGQDPEKFRKLFPDCSTSIIENEIYPQFGKELFEYIVTHFEKIINKTVNK